MISGAKQGSGLLNVDSEQRVMSTVYDGDDVLLRKRAGSAARWHKRLGGFFPIKSIQNREQCNVYAHVDKCQSNLYCLLSIVSKAELEMPYRQALFFLNFNYVSRNAIKIKSISSEYQTYT